MFSDQNSVCNSHLFHASYMPRPSHTHLFDHPNNIWWSVQVMKLLIMQSSPASYHFLPLRSKYSPQDPVPKVAVALDRHSYRKDEADESWRSMMQEQRNTETTTGLLKDGARDPSDCQFGNLSCGTSW
jgi:hypothetical protein